MEKFDNQKSTTENLALSPPRVTHVKTSATEWNIYRTRFLIKAKQLTRPLVFVDALGREHRGQPGDYLVESSDGSRSIQPRQISQDIYVLMGPADQTGRSLVQPQTSVPQLKGGTQPRSIATA
jgi:hypothetical protein